MRWVTLLMTILVLPLMAQANTPTSLLSSVEDDKPVDTSILRPELSRSQGDSSIDTSAINDAKDKADATTQLLTSENALDRRIGRLIEASENPFALLPYDENYILYTYINDLDRDFYKAQGYDKADKFDDHEIKFQVSLMFPLVHGLAGDNSVLTVSYTQLSLWQALNSEISSPFRETNYEPQIFMGWLVDQDLFGWKLRFIEAGFNHQSNGRSEPRSRSWNRIYADFKATRGGWLVSLKPWWRIPESDDDDDNPDIENYLGHYRVKVGYKMDESTFSGEFRYNWNHDKGSALLGWSHPILKNRIRFYTQVFYGYGESLIDYNHRETQLGIGFMVNDIL